MYFQCIFNVFFNFLMCVMKFQCIFNVFAMYFQCILYVLIKFYSKKQGSKTNKKRKAFNKDDAASIAKDPTVKRYKKRLLRAEGLAPEREVYETDVSEDEEVVVVKKSKQKEMLYQNNLLPH